MPCNIPLHGRFGPSRIVLARVCMFVMLYQTSDYYETCSISHIVCT